MAIKRHVKQVLRQQRQWTVVHGDCLKQLRRLPDDCVDSVVTDPPAGVEFLGQAWERFTKARKTTTGQNSDEWGAFGNPYARRATPRYQGGGGKRSLLPFQDFIATVFVEVLRVLKPGGHALVWALPRTSHHTAMGLERAGFEVRDCIQHLYGSGFPKSTDLGRTTSQKRWRGWGTALKPAAEFWWLVRKPLTSTITANVKRHGTGALNVQACRIDTGRETVECWTPAGSRKTATHSAGRWPANVIASHAVDCRPTRCASDCPFAALGHEARFFYASKPSQAERHSGCEDLFWWQRRGRGLELVSAAHYRRLQHKGLTVFTGNLHPTIKGIKLCSWLCRLVTPPGGVILDCFTGSGSLGCGALVGGFRFVGIERDQNYVTISRHRLRYWRRRRQPQPLFSHKDRS